MVRRLEKIFFARVSVKMGRSKGRQAPTMPSDDSTMGQYTVGVSRSIVEVSEVSQLTVVNAKILHVRSSSPAAVSESLQGSV